MITKIRWAIAFCIAPEMAPAALEMRDCLHQIYAWTTNKGTPWAVRTRAALAKAGIGGAA
jgi:hypothetical protein